MPHALTNAYMLTWWIDKPFIDFIRDDNNVIFTTQVGYHLQLLQSHHLLQYTSINTYNILVLPFRVLH